jgi:hypothetical protein
VILNAHHFNRLILYLQVSNVTDAIKIACDFVSLDNITMTQQLVGELRHQRLSTSWGDDVLQFYETLWYAWGSLSRPTYPILSSEETASFCAEASADDIQTTSQSSDHDPSDDSAMPMDVDLSTHATAQCGDQKHDAVTPPSAKVLRRRMHRKGKRAMEASSRNSAPKPGHDFRCPFATSSRPFNLGGLIDHLYVFVFYFLQCR